MIKVQSQARGDDKLGRRSVEDVTRSFLGRVLPINAQVVPNESIGSRRASGILSSVIDALGVTDLSKEQRLAVLKVLGQRGFDIRKDSEAGKRTRADLGLNPISKKRPKEDSDRELQTVLAEPMVVA